MHRLISEDRKQKTTCPKPEARNERKSKTTFPEDLLRQGSHH